MIYPLLSFSFFVILAVLLLLWGVAKTTYRLYFHPLRAYPGPILASVTNWHTFYYNWYCIGLHSAKITQWHEQYGPIVRIAPNELHFSHPDAYRAIYKHHGLRKNPAYYRFMGEDSLVGRLDIDDSKKHRRIFAGFFSASAIRTHSNIDGILTMKSNRLCSALKRLCSGDQTSTTVNMTDISRSFTYDVLNEVALGPSDVLSTTAPEFKPPFVVANSTVSNGLWFVQQFPFLVAIARMLPGFLLSQNLLVLRLEREKCCNEVINRSRSLDGSESPHPHTALSICSGATTARLRNPKMWISDYNLGLEIFDFFMAGTELPANAISFGVFHVARHPAIVNRLRKELVDANFRIDDQVRSLICLEKLPFLNAVVKETLRLGNLVPGRLPRLTPLQGMSIAGLHIPGGTVVSASSHLVHMNSIIFPEPEKFVPERWLVNEQFDPDKYLFAFSAGSRECIGSALAVAEIRSVIACLVSIFDMEPASPQDYILDLTWKDNIVASYDRDVQIGIRMKKPEETD